LRRIAFVSCTHCGSRFALWPWKVNAGVPIDIELAKIRRKILSYWWDFVEQVEKARCDSVVLLGDLIEGQNSKEYGTGLITSKVSEQLDGFIEIAKPLCKNRKTGIVEGTSYHVQLSGDPMEKHLCTTLNAEWLGFIVNKQIEPSDLVFNMAHGYGGGGTNVATPIETEIKEMLIAEAQGLIPHIDVVVRGHIHSSDADITMRGKRFIRVPSWKAFGDWKRMGHYYGRHQPIIGGKIVTVYKDDIDIKLHKYPTPKLKSIDGKDKF